MELINSIAKAYGRVSIVLMTITLFLRFRYHIKITHPAWIQKIQFFFMEGQTVLDEDSVKRIL